MIKTTGVGIVKILVLVKPGEFDYWFQNLKLKAGGPKNLEILVAGKEDTNFIQKLVEENQKSPFIFILDLSADGETIEGYGNRYRGIIERIFGNELQIDEMNEEYAKWFSAHTEFSVIQVGINNPSFEKIVDKIFDYFNGTKI